MNKCRRRPSAAPHPDADAILLLLKIQLSIFDRHRPVNPSSTLGELLSRNELDGFCLLNHMIMYLEDPKKYRDELRPKLYSYLEIR